jgi:hypothetical protein
LSIFQACVLLMLTSGPINALAQREAPLPKAMSGHWVEPWQPSYNDRNYSDAISVTFDGDGAPGPVTGRLTRRGILCGAVNEPLTGTWDGVELRFVAVNRPNMNTHQPDGNCSRRPWKYLLVRKPEQTAFEGDGRSPGGTYIQIMLSP